MKVLMLGWEFPPFISGGLGTACYGLTRGLSRLGAEILFVLPRAVPATHASHVRLLTCGAQPGAGVARGAQGLEKVRFQALPVALNPYARPEVVAAGGAKTPARTCRRAEAAGHYGGGLFDDVQRYTELVWQLARREDFDVVHAHDWMTFAAATTIATHRGKPLVVHVHSTEFDRSGRHVHQRIYDLERMGMHAADVVIAVSKLTRHVVTSRYGVSADKVRVVYNAMDADGLPARRPPPTAGRNGKSVLFLGRLTMQKGPEFFIAAARQVLEVLGDVRFIMAGSGDLMGRSMQLAARMGIADRVLFTGFLRGAEVEQVFRMADLFVMPSVSEPFGLVALEAISHDVPVIVSRQSGVAEVLDRALKVNYWDVGDLAGKIVAVLRQPALHAALRDSGWQALGKLSWNESARQCLDAYRAVVRG